MPGRPTVARGLDPAGAWESVNGKVTQRPADQELELRELDGDFDGFLVDYKAKGHAVEYVGREKAGGIDTYRLKVTLKSGAVRHVYLDATTYLERKQEGTMTLPDGKVPVILTFGDWRDVEGVKFPFAIDEERVSFPPQTFAIYTERIELNPAVDDATFRDARRSRHNKVRVRSPSQRPPRRDPDSRRRRLGGPLVVARHPSVGATRHDRRLGAGRRRRCWTSHAVVGALWHRPWSRRRHLRE